MLVFAQEQMAVFAQDLRWRFPGGTFLIHEVFSEKAYVENMGFDSFLCET